MVSQKSIGSSRTVLCLIQLSFKRSTPCNFRKQRRPVLLCLRDWVCMLHAETDIRFTKGLNLLPICHLLGSSLGLLHCQQTQTQGRVASLCICLQQDIPVVRTIIHMWSFLIVPTGSLRGNKGHHLFIR